MVFAIHSEASHHSELVAQCRASEHHFLFENVPFPANNGVVLNLSTVIKGVMSLMVEAELGVLFLNTKAAVPIRKMLEEMRHKQPLMPLQKDNSTAHGITTNKIQPKAKKAMDQGSIGCKTGKPKSGSVFTGGLEPIFGPIIG